MFSAAMPRLSLAGLLVAVLLLPRGRYVLRARGTDRSGRTSGTDAQKVRLRVR